MKKSCLVFILVVLAILTYSHEKVFSEETNINEEIKLKYPKDDDTCGCIDKCGDGSCAAIVCFACNICPCAETPKTCPEDCSNIKEDSEEDLNQINPMWKKEKELNREIEDERWPE